MNSGFTICGPCAGDGIIPGGTHGEVVCPRCHGEGRIPDSQANVSDVIRWIKHPDGPIPLTNHRTDHIGIRTHP